jgi:hypothetical protein
MDANGIASLASRIAGDQTRQDVGVAVLKKAMDAQASTAMQLLAALPRPQGANPPNLGNSVDTYA